jgi:hypothetical protein
MESCIDSVIDLLDIESQNIDQIVEIFESVLGKIFEDNSYNQGRFTVVEHFASRIVERSPHLDTDLLLTNLNDRIVAIYLRWLQQIN